MLTQLRRRLGKLKDKLERRVETMHSGGRPRSALQPISAADKDLMLEWFTGEVDDDAVIDRARSEPGGRDLIERACAARPANARIWATRAEFSVEDGDLESALEHSERAYALGRLQPEVGLVHVRVLVAGGRREQALEVLSGSLEDAHRVNAHATRLELCREWQALEPDSIEPQLESARTRVTAGELDTAIAELEKLRADHGPRTDVLLPLAAIYQDVVRPQDALRTYMAAVETEPGNVDALCMAGSCALDLGESAAADKLLTRAFEADPASPFVQYYLGLLRLHQGRIDETAVLMFGARAATRGEHWAGEEFEARLATPVERALVDVEWATARFKLVHDIEQFEYLKAQQLVGPALDPVIAEYKAVLRDPRLPKDAYSMVALDPAPYPLLARSYKMPLHAADPEPPQGPLVNPDLPWKQIEEQYYDAKPGIVTIDNLLAPEALAAVRAFCMESTIWNQLKGGYLGAYMPDGFSGRLLLRIATELRARMPRVVRDHPLQTMWGYKYDSRYAGIGVHADVAAINVNFWVTPDEANLDPESGGLIVYTHDAPEDWSFRRFNVDREPISAYLESVGAKKIKVPYRANRAVIFNSDLFHETDAFRFKEGYENRRINVTMLYGTRAG